MAFPGGRSETRNASTATERRSIETIQARYWKVLRHSFKMASALNRPKAAFRDKQRCLGATAPTRCAQPTLSPANHEEIRLKSFLMNIRCLPTLYGAPTIPWTGCACHDSCNLRRHPRGLRFPLVAPFALDSIGRQPH